MACQKFTVLYTHQKTKKSKVWHDGILKSSVGGNKATLYDDKGQILDSIFLKCQVNPGDDLESERYLIMVEAEKTSETDCNDQPKNTEVPILMRNCLKSFAPSSLHLPVGLKRKFTGFQGPRQVEKKMTTMEEPAAVMSPTPKNSLSSFPSQFYISSPLFSVPYKKDTNSLPNFNGGTFLMNDRVSEFVTSLASSPYVDDDKVIQSRNHSIGKADTEDLKPESQQHNGMVSSNYCASNVRAVSQNIRSKAQIIALLQSREQEHSNTPDGETAASVKNSLLTSVELECHPDGLPQSEASRSTDFLFKQKIAPLSESTNISNEETTKHTEQLYSAGKNLQTKSQWDIYLPSSLAEEPPDLGAAEHNDKNASDLQPVKKDMKKNGAVNRSQNSEDHTISSPVPISLEINISPIGKSPVKTQPPSFVPTEFSVTKGNDTEVSSSGDINYSNCIRTLSASVFNCSKSNKYTANNLEGFYHQSQNESSLVIRSECFSGDSTYGGIGELDKQFPEVNFNLLDAIDFSDAEDGRLCANSTLSQGSVYSKKAAEMQLEDSVLMTCEDKTCSKRKDNVQTAFLQYRNTNCMSESQPLYPCGEISKDPNKMKENGVTLQILNEPGYSEATTVDKKIENNTITIHHKDNKGVHCTGRDLLMVNDVYCGGNDNEYPIQRTQLGKRNVTSGVSATSDTDVKSNKKSMEVEVDNSQFGLIDICDTMKPASPSLAFIEKDSAPDGFSLYISDKHYAVPEESCDLDFRPAINTLHCEASSDETQMNTIELNNAENALDAIYKSNEDQENNSTCAHPSVVDSSSLPKMADGFSLLKSLTEHSTALESLQMIEESTEVLFQRERLTMKPQQKFEVPCPEDEQRSYCLYSGAPNMYSSFNNDVEMPRATTAKMQHDHSSFGVTCIDSKPVEFQGYQVKGSAASEIMMRKPCSHITWDSYAGMAELERVAEDVCFFSAHELSNNFIKPLGSRKHSENYLSNITTENFHKEFTSEEQANNECLRVSVSSKLPNQNMTHSPSDLNLDFPHCASREPNKMLSMLRIPLQSSDCHSFPSQSSEETIDIQEQEFLMSRIVPEPVDNARSLFEMEEYCCPEDKDRSVFLSPLRRQTPIVTVPVDEKLPDSEIYSSVKSCEQVQQSFGFPVVSMCDKSKMLRPEDRICETFVGKKCIGERQEALTQSAFPHASEQKRQSKWQKYQNTIHCDLRTQNSSEVAMTDDFRAESVLGMPLDDTEESQSDAINTSPPDFVHLQMIKSMLCKQQRNFSSQDSISEEKKLSLHLNQFFSTEEAPKVLGQLNCHNITRHAKNTAEFCFPSAEIVNCTNVPKRQMCIPIEFQSCAHYKQAFTAALMEHLNILLFELSYKLHRALGKVDISFYTSVKEAQTKENSAPLCYHKMATKLVIVKKEGRNKGRLFYSCDAPKADQCDFFKWLDDINPGQIESMPSIVLHDIKSIGTYLRSQKISLYEECQLLVRKAFEVQRKQIGKLKKFPIANASFDCDSRSKLYLKLNQKEHSSMYSKDDLWVVSKTLTFEPMDTFIACSVFFGPSSSNEIELVPLKGYSPSSWRSNMIVHALLVCNASTELTTLRNIEESFSSATLPIMNHLLTKPFKNVSSSDRVNKRKFKPPALNINTVNCELLSPEMMISLANKMIQTFHLNKDQAMALIQIGSMMTSQEIDTELGKQPPLPITVIHGVFGSGKSYLLAVVILFLVQIFESSEATDGKRSVPWKILISSSTNVAVDRILLCLLDLGFEEFIRVGSIRKIAKPILPYSLHAGSGPENEQLKELLALMKEDLNPAEKIYVRKTIEQHKLGTNKTRLQQVRVVGATCAACPFSCMKNLKFPIVMLDECSQMTEPVSLLPIARFDCEKLILVGDPKQLSPTIQGSESTHGNGLEQTLFDRLCLMGHKPILLRTQYRCHPAICAIANNLFYEGNLLNGISEMNRTPLVDWLPILCFYNVNGLEQVERDNSFHNMAESFFIVKLIQSLIASGIEGSMIGVITLYKSQMGKICNLLGAVHSDASQIKAVQVSTVDAFQGAEKEIIVLSCVRTRQVGFIDSEKRVNVALTRGKRHLLIVGHLNCLRKNKLWGNVVQHCEERKDGLQHVGECEQQLNDILKSYLEKKKEEEINAHKEKSKSK